MLRTGLRWSILTLALSANVAEGVTFDHVVTLGDSLLDDNDGGRSPVAAEHVAERLGVGLTKFAQSGATSTALINQGQHTQAAANFGAGDLAILWIGGNDFFGDPFEVAFGGTGFLNTLQSNVDTVMATLDSAGMDIVALNLPDMSKVPGVIEAVEIATVLTPFLRPLAFRNITDATVEWNTRLNSVASNYGATVVDVFTGFEELAADPSAFSLLGHDPILNADTGCQFCVFFDDAGLPDVHPSSFAQGFIANDAIEATNAAYDPGGVMLLEPLSIVELALLADLLAGDFDENDVVDSVDLATLESNYGTNGAATHMQGDADGNFVVNGRDALIWQRQFGSGALPLAQSSSRRPREVESSQAIPEPSSILLAAVFTLFSCMRFAER